MEERESGGVVCRLHERACRKVWECGLRDLDRRSVTVGRSLGRKTCHDSAVCMTADQLYRKIREQNDARQRPAKKRLLAASMAESRREAAVHKNVAYELPKRGDAVEGGLYRTAQRMTRDGGL